MMLGSCAVWMKFLALPIIFLSYTGMIASFVTHIATFKLDAEQEINVTVFKFPSSKTDVIMMAHQLKLYKNTYPWHIDALFCLVYLYKQAFAIPGSFFMNLLAGALYGTAKGLAITCLMTSVGATACYVLSSYFCKPVLQLLLSRQINQLSRIVELNKNGLFFYLLGSRIFPASPNWLLNVLSPIVGIPCGIFSASLLLGLLPYNLITVQAGTLLSQIDPEKSIKENVLPLSGVAIIIIITGVLVPKVRKYVAPESKEKTH